MRKIWIFVFVVMASLAQAQKPQLALMKYRGGGDWYADPTALPNLIAFCNEQLQMNLEEDYALVEPDDNDIYSFPFVHLTGHGNIVFSEREAENLRKYLLAGGFLHIDDNYGLDKYIRGEMKKVFPDKEFVELPFSHPIYHQHFDFEKGLPKIHEHDNKPPQGFAIVDTYGRVLVFYTYECDISDGWEDATVHNNPPEKRLKALQMGANILQFVFMEN